MPACSSPQKESSKCKPRGNYGLAKYKASKYLVNFRNLKFRYLILRLYQVYGPHQDTSRLIPHAITSCINKKNFNCTSGKQLRDFLFVDDILNLFVKILKSKKKTLSKIPITLKKNHYLFPKKKSVVLLTIKLA